MQMKELVRLISSLHHRHSLCKSEIHNVCMDTLGSMDANTEVNKELKAYVDAAFTACPKELQAIFKEQDRQNELLSSRRFSLQDTIPQRIKHLQGGDNVITGYFN